METAVSCDKHYFMAVNFGYFIAIICTIIVMLVWDHGQPALLYLVPGCILSVLCTAKFKGELAELWEFNEDEFIAFPDDDPTVKRDAKQEDVIAQQKAKKQTEVAQKKDGPKKDD